MTRSTTAMFPLNVRDLGGTPLVGGGAVRPGLLFRGDDPGRGDQVSGDRLTSELGIRHVLDLRHAEEFHRTGTLGTFVVRPDVVHHPLQLTLRDAMGEAGIPADARSMGELYVRSVEVSAPSYVTALETIAEVEEPLLVHCSHGKDRTGIVTALVLSALGAEPAAIVADFAVTGRNLPAMYDLARDLGVSIGLSVVHGIMREAPAEAMSTFLEVAGPDPLAPLYGAGLREQTVQRLRARLIDSA